MNPREVAERWFAQALASLDVPLYRHPAPEQASTPFITVGLRTAVDLSPIGAGGTCEKLTYDVSAWDEGLSAEVVNGLAAGITSTLLACAPTTTDLGTIVSCRRLGAIPISVITERGKTFQRDGSVFELIVTS